MAAEDGLKAQKLLAQGSALGNVVSILKPRALPWAKSFCPFYYICTWKNKEVKIFISANFC